LSTNAALAMELTLSRHDDATTRRFKKDHEEHRATKKTLKSYFGGSCPAGGAALRAVAGARGERIASGRFVALTACDPLASQSCDAGQKAGAPPAGESR